MLMKDRAELTYKVLLTLFIIFGIFSILMLFEKETVIDEFIGTVYSNPSIKYVAVVYMKETYLVDRNEIIQKAEIKDKVLIQHIDVTFFNMHIREYYKCVEIINSE